MVGLRWVTGLLLLLLMVHRRRRHSRWRIVRGRRDIVEVVLEAGVLAAVEALTAGSVPSSCSSCSSCSMLGARRRFIVPSTVTAIMLIARMAASIISVHPVPQRMFYDRLFGISI